MMGEAVWRFAAASVIGTSHGVSGSPCQDSHTCRVFTDQRGQSILAIAVSDGAGSAKYSDVGSSLACSAAIEQIELFLHSGGQIDQLSAGHAREWLDSIREWIAERASDQDAEMRDYACTILVAIVGDEAAAFVQIGDGAIVVRDTSSEYCWIFWPERGEFANTTYFVTDAAAENNLKFEKCLRRVDELAIFTDGIEALVLHYASQTVYAPFFARMFQPIRESPIAGDDQELSKKLSAYLSSPVINSRTDDDKTLVLASRCKPEVENSETAEDSISATPSNA